MQRSIGDENLGIGFGHFPSLLQSRNHAGSFSLCTAVLCASHLWRKRALNRPRRAASQSDARATYVKAWVGKIRWAGECGAVVSLTGVYEYCNAGLPNQFLAFLDATQADTFQRGLFGEISSPGYSDDHVCDVRVHGTSFPFGELVMRQECPVQLEGGLLADEAPPHLMSDVMDLCERRLPCSIGEALATSQRLAVPALVCVAYLLQAAKNCIDKALLEGAFCREQDEAQECDLELWELRERLHRWNVEAEQGVADAAEGGHLLRDLNAFAWYWIFSKSSLSFSEEDKRDWETFGDFRRQYQQLHGQFPF